MKKLVTVVILLVVALVVGGCSSHQSSSKEEAKFVIQNLPDFQEFVQYLSVETTSNIDPYPTKPTVYQSAPLLQFQEGQGKGCVHEVIYKTKSGSFKLVLLKDDRPPKITATKEFK
jgi:PBP1b-binding outer membrane lipoprotein LpoB